jgi:hypothetical protein
MSAGAVQKISVGNRKMIAISDGFFLMPRDFLGTHENPTAAHDALEAELGEVRLPVGCFLGLLTFPWVIHRPGSGGQSPASLSIARAMRAAGE